MDGHAEAQTGPSNVSALLSSFNFGNVPFWPHRLHAKCFGCQSTSFSVISSFLEAIPEVPEVSKQ